MNDNEMLLEAAWGLIANAGGGNWTKESQDWQKAAARWRDDYHKAQLEVQGERQVLVVSGDGVTQEQISAFREEWNKRYASVDIIGLSCNNVQMLTMKVKSK